MVTRTLRALLLVVAASCAGGPDLGSATSPIFAGSLDIGADPAVGIIFLEDSTRHILFICSGAFITPRIVLTAAHCSNNADGVTQYEVYRADSFDGNTGKFNGLEDPKAYKSVKVIYDTLYVDGEAASGHDVGLIFVDHALPSDVKPIPLYPQRLAASSIGTDVRYVGFGLRQEIADQTDFEKVTASFPIENVSASTFGWTDNPHPTCHGDSGGPNLVKIGDIEYVAGVTSYVTGACAGGASQQQRTDTEMDLIMKFIADNNPQTPACVADGVCDVGCKTIDPDCPCGGDGKCNPACSDPDLDPDCPIGCKADGFCARTGCPTPDPDCGSKQTGDTCANNNECVSGFCVPDGAAKICVPSCGSGGSCPSGFTCTQPSNTCLKGDSGGGGGCAVTPGGGGTGGAGAGGWLALALAALFTWRRRRA